MSLFIQFLKDRETRTADRHSSALLGKLSLMIGQLSLAADGKRSIPLDRFRTILT